jgi:uncharacterized membrane protein YqiK
MLIQSLVVFAILVVLIKSSGMLKYIPNDRVGVVEKLWSRHGSLAGGLIALSGEAGYQPEVLRGGIHFFAPFQYRVHKVGLVTITQGQIGYVFARDGQPLGAGQTLASNRDAGDFENVRAFLEAGGQKGPQRKILREGTHALNLAQFTILTEAGPKCLSPGPDEKALYASMLETIEERGGFHPVVLKDDSDEIGIVTIHDGRALASGELIAPLVGANVDDEGFHNNYQDPDTFASAGGFRGRQMQVLVDGTYYLNALFATVERNEKTVVQIGFVGVVVSYTGPSGSDLSDTQYRHGELVENGNRGVWIKPLMPGKYAFNIYAGEIVMVPTTNFILKWSNKYTSEHQLDANLKEVTLITKDAFEPTLPLSVVVHIDYKKAPHVVQRFGDIRKLVEQTLDPMVSAYFKNVAQMKTLIQLLQERSDIQRLSSDEMREKFAAYSLELQEVLIGTPRSQEGNTQIEDILGQLRDRQLAVEQVETYRLREKASDQERTLREAEAKAQQQTAITNSALSVQMKMNEGAAEVAYATEKAKRMEIDAKANANVNTIEAEGVASRERIEGGGEAARIIAVGEARAKAATAQAEAFGGPAALIQRDIAEMFTTAIKEGKIAITPQIQIGAGGTGSAGDAMMGVLLSNMATNMQPNSKRPENEAVVQ